MKIRKSLVALIIALALLSLPAFSQEAGPQVVNFITEDGLAPGMPVVIAKDPGGWMWVGSVAGDQDQGGGLSIINANHRILTYGKQDGLASDDVYDIFFDVKNGGIWFATANGLSRWDTVSGVWKLYTVGSAGSRINVIFPEENGQMLLGTHGDGLYKFDFVTGLSEKIKCPFNTITGILLDKKNRLWVSSWEGAGYRENEVWVAYSTGNSNLATNQIDYIAEAADGRILGATQKGMVIFDGIVWSIQDTSNSKFPVDQITSILPEEDGGLWITTWGGGIVHVSRLGKIDKIYSRKNTNLLDNRISSLIKDGEGNLWATTGRGVAVLTSGAARPKTGNVVAVDVQGYKWENRSGGADKDMTIETGLARDYFGTVLWDWAGLIADKGYDSLEPGVTVNSGVSGNKWLTFFGQFPELKFVQGCVTEKSRDANPVIDRVKQYPFPGNMPAEVQLYLRSGNLIPANDPDIKKLAESLVRNSSKADMLRTAEDIIFSKFFANMPIDEKERTALAGPDSIVSDPKVKFFRDAQTVIKDKYGADYSKNRLAASMLKSLGIPSRITAKNGEKVLGEAWINGIGWVPFDISTPVFAIGKDVSSRIQFPMILDEKNIGVVSVSGSDDNLKRFVWTPSDSSLLVCGKGVADELTAGDFYKKVKFIAALPSETESVPIEAKIPIAPEIYMMVKKDGNSYNVKFYDPSNHEIKRYLISEMDQTISVEVYGKVFFDFIPTKADRYILIRMVGNK